MRTIFVAFCISLTSAFNSPATGAEPVWIGPDRSIPNVTIAKEFLLGSPATEASLRIAVDFCEAEVEINGVVVATVTPFDLPLAIPVQRWCEMSQNSIRIAMLGDGGPTAVAIALRFSLEDGTVREIHSDSSWRVVRPRADPVPATTFGSVEADPWWQIKTRPTTSAFDEYNQWQEAKDAAIDASRFQVPDGFSVRTVYEVPSELGSWISMTLDDQGRILAGRERSGIARLTLSKGGKTGVEIINEDLKGCHGILWADSSLFVNASDSKALYRLRDSNGDNSFDDLKLLREVPGGGGDHGRNHLVVGPNGMLYSIHGDAVDLPDGFSSRVPTTREFPDGRPKGGHLVATDTGGSTWEVIASGLRNPYSVAFNRDGEAFTYDADSERHVGLPWYRPTRMNHLVPGADYGWRSRGELPWPIYHPDSLPPNVLIGRGSPTVVKFGYTSHFPPPYDQLLFAGDWSFGRLFAVHVVPRGASYSMHPQTFMRGRPLNVVDIEFAANGMMYVLTGGYGTRSTLYQVRYNGPSSTRAPLSTQQRDRAKYSTKMRRLRRALEAAQPEDLDSVEFAWNHLSHPDRWIRHAARTSLERQPTGLWQDRTWTESDPGTALHALLALVRVAMELDSEQAWSRLAATELANLPLHLQVVASRIAGLLVEFDPKTAPSDEVLKQFETMFPSGRRELDRELCSLLVSHHSTKIIEKTLELLSSNPEQQDALHYLLALSKAEHGWNTEHREEYFRLLQGTNHYLGDEGLPDVIRNLQAEALEAIPASVRPRFAELLSSAENDGAVEASVQRPIIRHWTMADFPAEQLRQLRGNLVEGKRVFQEAQCSACHRLGTVGRSVGPDLSGIANRFRRAEILESTLKPSKSISSRYANHVIVTTDGRQHTGQLVWNGFRKSVIRLALDPKRLDQTIEISKHHIESQYESSVSPMPEGLLNPFRREEIESLLNFIESDGRTTAR